MRKQTQIKKQTKNYQTSDKLWVKLNSKNNQNYQQSTQKSSKITYKTDLKPMNSNKLKTEQQNNNIHQFLEEVHNKVKDSINDSQSQILQKMSIDWPQEEIRKSHKKMQSQQILFFQTVSILNQGSKTQRTFNDDVSLKELKSVSELQMLLAKVNPTIYLQIQGLLYENIKLIEECNALKYNQKKITIKNRILQNQVDVIENKNVQLSKQNQKFKNRIQYISQSSQMSEQSIKKEDKFQNLQQKIQITESIITENQQKQSRKQNQRENQKNNSKEFKNLSLQFQKAQSKLQKNGENVNKCTLLSPYHYNSIISEIFQRKK